MKSCFLIAILLGFPGCSNEDLSPVDPWTPDSTIHLAGQSGGGTYWKNGVYNALNEGGLAQVQSMSVDGSTVLIGGWSRDGDVIWKNGEQTIVDTEAAGGVTLVAARGGKVFGVWTTPEWVIFRGGFTIQIENTGWPTAMAVLGDDVYIGGSSQGKRHPWGVSPFYHLDTYAICWKNDQEIFRDTVNSYANTIFIHEDDIYLGGHLNQYPSLNVIACYWKNGQRFTLTKENQDAEVRSLFVTDTHLFAAGVINDQAVYWKDGVATFLSRGGISSTANSISVLGTDVYVAGQEDKYPAVWMNGVKQDIPNQDKQGEIKVVVAVSN